MQPKRKNMTENDSIIHQPKRKKERKPQWKK
jgi:hypothetical protein